MDIAAEIKGIKYIPKNISTLPVMNFNEFDINDCPTSCFVNKESFQFTLSKWVSPKRTRSYPFERVYNTLGFTKKVTVIPMIKDEGKNGDRDFIQWDTISLMSLLDVYVILGYYADANIHLTRSNKITDQKFDNTFVKSKLIEISNYHSSALHWNLKEISNFENLSLLIDKVKRCYMTLSKKLDVKFHDVNGIEKFQKQFIGGVQNFMTTSREKAKSAQQREKVTIQPKEALFYNTKATITIKNYLGGLYYFTTDEVLLENNMLYLIEGKHSKNALLPSISDIKDGLLKMILYSNLENITVNEINYTHCPVLKMTSTILKSKITSQDDSEKIQLFFDAHAFNKKQQFLIKNLFKEAVENHFIILIEPA